MALTLYGIPNCGTVKKAKKWLEARDVAYTFVNYRETDVPAQTIAGWVSDLGSKPMRNTSGGAYRALPDDKKTWSDEVWAEHFAADNMLIRRPLIVRDGTAILAGFRGSDDVLAEKLGV